MINKMSPIEAMNQYDLHVCYGFDPYHNRDGGVTIVYRKCENHRNTRMVEVSVAYCSPGDAFNKKEGLALALDRWLDGNTVMVPARTDKSDTTIISNLLSMFWYNLHY